MHPDATPPMTGSQLPRLGWHGDSPLDLAKFEPVTRVPGWYIAMYTKPQGGLWTTPLQEHDGILCNSWVSGHGGRSKDGDLWEVLPDLDAKVYVVSNPLDLAEAIKTYPDPRNTGPWLDRGHRSTPREVALIDWPAMAKDFDAFYLTTEGVRYLNRPYYDFEPHAVRPSGRRRLPEHLALWDVPTVLWLQPSFEIGPAHPADQETIARFDAARTASDEADAIEIRDSIIKAATEKGIELPDELLQMAPIGFVMVFAAVAREDGGD